MKYKYHSSIILNHISIVALECALRKYTFVLCIISRGIILSNGALCYGNWTLLKTIIIFMSLLLENTCQIESLRLVSIYVHLKSVSKWKVGKDTFWVLKKRSFNLIVFKCKYQRLIQKNWESIKSIYILNALHLLYD